MSRISNRLLATFTLLFTLPVWALDANDLNDPKVIEAYVDGVVKPLMAEGHSPSGVFVLMKDGEVVFRKGYGWQNVAERIPVDPETTLFRPGSISKLFTWVSVMQLVEQGKLDLDADINTYLKTFQIKDTFPGQPVTLRHCMTHTPGFEDGALGYLIIEDPEKVIPLAAAMKKYQPERVNPPGVVGAYSNYCTSLSGLVVANVSGMSFIDYVEKNIFSVLGMDNSSFNEPLPDRLDKNMAVAYKYEAGNYVARPYELITNFTPAGALAATAEDMLKFGSALLNGGVYNGGSILKPETLTEMNLTQFTYDDRIKGIGLGFLHYPWGDTDTFGHDGGTTAFFSHLGITPSARLIIFSSFSGPGGAKVNGTLRREFYKEFFALPPFHDTPPSGFNDRANKFAGTFSPWRSGFSKLEKLVGLFGQVDVAPDGQGGLLIGEHHYVEIGDKLFRNVENGDLVAFQENSQGDITGYVPDGWSPLSMYKARGYANMNLSFGLIGLAIIVFLAVFFRYLYQRERLQAMSVSERSAYRATVFAATSHLWVLILGGIVAVAVGDQLMARIPLLFKFWLIFPIIASLASLYLLYQTTLVWKNGLLAGKFVRIRYSIVCLCALYMTWFYYFWNILGFKYYG